MAAVTLATRWGGIFVTSLVPINYRVQQFISAMSGSASWRRSRMRAVPESAAEIADCPCAAKMHVSVPVLENQDDQQKHDLSLVRRHRAGRCEVLRRDVPGQRCGSCPSRAWRLSGGQGGRCLDGRVHGGGHPLSRTERGPAFKHNEAFSFQIATDDQAETDRLWNAIVGNGGEESACGWCKDKWGLSWQITPRVLTAAITNPDRAAAKRAFDAMMKMRKIDIAAIEAALAR